MKPLTPIHFESHPPERRRRTETLMCGCCCCCCCCLHTVGGIVGSAVAPAFGKKNPLPIHYYYDEEWDIQVPDVARPGISAVKLFWMITLVLSIIGVLMSCAGGGDGIVVGLVIIAMVFPALQLGSAFFTLLTLLIAQRDDRRFQLRQLGKITLGLFVGTLAGIMAMVGIGLMMR